MQKRRQAKVVNLAAYRKKKLPRTIAAFAGRNADFRLYLLAMRTWLAWERTGARGCR